MDDKTNKERIYLRVGEPTLVTIQRKSKQRRKRENSCFFPGHGTWTFFHFKVICLCLFSCKLHISVIKKFFSYSSSSSPSTSSFNCDKSLLTHRILRDTETFVHISKERSRRNNLSKTTQIWTLQREREKKIEELNFESNKHNQKNKMLFTEVSIL